MQASKFLTANFGRYDTSSIGSYMNIGVFTALRKAVTMDGEDIAALIAANKVKGARCALAWSVETAKLAREHNNAQLIGLGGRMHSEEEALAIVDAFISQPWSNEERHQRRIDILADYEKTGIAPALPEQE